MCIFYDRIIITFFAINIHPKRKKQGVKMTLRPSVSRPFGYTLNRNTTTSPSRMT